MTATPAVTVLMTMFNAEQHLRASVESILGQTFADFEFLVVDDGSQDESVRLLESFGDGRIRLIRNAQNKGQTACLNEGLAVARGEWIARQDADDVSLPGRLARQVAVLRAEPALALLGCQAWLMNGAGKFTGLLNVPLGPESLEWAALWENPFVHTGVVFRREVAQKLGGYDAGVRICQDYDLWVRILAEHSARNVAERLVIYRHTEQSLQHSGRELAERESAAVLRAHVARVFPGLSLSEEDFARLLRFRSGLPAAAVPAFHALSERLLAEYARGHRAVVESADFRRTQALHLAKLGRAAVGQNPLNAVGEFLRAMRLDPPLLFQLARERLTGPGTIRT